MNLFEHKIKRHTNTMQKQFFTKMNAQSEIAHTIYTENKKKKKKGDKI